MFKGALSEIIKSEYQSSLVVRQKAVEVGQWRCACRCLATNRTFQRSDTAETHHIYGTSQIGMGALEATAVIGLDSTPQTTPAYFQAAMLRLLGQCRAKIVIFGSLPAEL